VVGVILLFSILILRLYSSPSYDITKTYSSFIFFSSWIASKLTGVYKNLGRHFENIISIPDLLSTPEPLLIFKRQPRLFPGTMAEESLSASDRSHSSDENIRETRHTHTHHGSATRHLHTPSVPRDASAQVLSTALNGANESISGEESRPKRSLLSPEHNDVPIPRSVPTGNGQPRKAPTVSRSSSADSARNLIKEGKIKENRAKAEAAINAFGDGQKSAANDLAEIARTHGIHPSLRCKAWPILLETHPFARKEAAKNLTTCPSPISEEESLTDIPIKRIRGEISRYHRRKKHQPGGRIGTPPPSGSPRPDSRASTSTSGTNSLVTDPELLDQLALDTAIEFAIITYLEAHPQVPYTPGMVFVAFTLSEWIYESPNFSLDRSDGEYLDAPCPALTVGFEQMMTILTWYPATTIAKLRHKPDTAEEELDEVISRRISHFLSVFRKLLPELDSYFDEEEANGFGEEWVRNWIQWWCARELQSKDKARLWDLYLGYRSSTSRMQNNAACTPDDSSVSIDMSDGDGEDEAPPRDSSMPTDTYSPFDWHPYVCLALLKCCKDAVEELELSEIRTLLSRLPEFGNMDAIISVAARMRTELRILGEKEDEEAARRAVSLR
jgi:hypothetical protein